MKEILTKFHNTYNSTLSDLSIGYNVERVDICELWEMMCFIHFMENAELTEEEMLTLKQKFLRKSNF